VRRVYRPAAYLRLNRPDAPAATGHRGHSLREAAVRRGWSAPAIYIDEGIGQQHGQALSRLTAAIESGRYDALLIAGASSVMSSNTGQLMRLLGRCTRNGIPVVFVMPTEL
jgi:DNA invertase Pin-like site-specific DNA recombinase